MCSAVGEWSFVMLEWTSFGSGKHAKTPPGATEGEFNHIQKAYEAMRTNCPTWMWPSKLQY